MTAQETTSSPRRVFVCAFAAEARPLVEQYCLRGVASRSPWSLYRSDSTDAGRTALVVTGLGRVAAAAAVSYSACFWGTPKSTIWINVGIAGHPTLPLGTVRVCHRVRDGAGGSWYPPQLSSESIERSPLMTVDEPSTDYPEDSLFDMEGAGFIDTAWRFSWAELVQLVKVVADNREHPAGKPDPAAATRWIEAALPKLDPWFETLERLGAEVDYQARWRVKDFEDRWRMSRSRSRELQDILRRWEALDLNEGLGSPWSHLEDARDAAEVIVRLRERLERVQLSAGGGAV